MTDVTKTCTKCGETKPIDGFYSWRYGAGGIRAECAECSRRRARDYATRVRGGPPRHERGPQRLTCAQCREPFEYQPPERGRLPKYCSALCRRRRDDEGRAVRWGRETEARQLQRKCACGSSDVKAVGKPVCPECQKDRRSRSEAARAKERRRTLRKYGLTQAGFDQLLTSQGGRCAICRSADPVHRQWHIDHCHRSGRVRGLLCHHCNLALGHLKDDPHLFLSAVRYLEVAAA